MITIRDVLKEKGDAVQTIGKRESLPEAVARLNAHRIGALVVRDESGGVGGILTERDILRAISKDFRRFGELTVADVMTAEVLTGRLGQEIGEVMALMTERRFRHLPVVEQGRLAGIISIGDAVKALIDHHARENAQLKSYISGSLST